MVHAAWTILHSPYYYGPCKVFDMDVNLKIKIGAQQLHICIYTGIDELALIVDQKCKSFFGVFQKYLYF